jgi:hypothetical protein
MGFVQLINYNYSYDNGDTFVIAFGVSGKSSSDDDDFLQVTGKCVYAMREAMVYLGYANDEDTESVNCDVSSDIEENNSVLIIASTNLTVNIKK